MKQTLAFWLKILIVAGALTSVAVLYVFDAVRENNLLWEVPGNRPLPFLESRWTYVMLHAFTFIPVFFLSFDKNVQYFRKWGALFPAMLMVGAFFVGWDVYFTKVGVWGFNENYFAGFRLFELPLEEWLFFLTVPFACVFIYECLLFYVKKDWLKPFEPYLSILLVITLLTVGILNLERMYTGSTFLWSGLFLLYHFLFVQRGNEYRTRFYLAYLVSLVPFFLVNGVLTGSYTDAPVVVYNPEEYLGIRIGTVPLDDAVYSFLLLLGVITFYENFKTQNKPVIQ